MEALRIFRCDITVNIHIAFTNTLKIINLSDNELTSIGFLKNCQDL
jgi:hypothetical protein